jgi:serine/threonine protein phosphatase PrpC/CRP-like cAMP-binding protein
MPRNEDAHLAEPKVPLFAIADASGAVWPGEVALELLGREAEQIQAFERAVGGGSASSARLGIGHFFEDAMNRASQRLREELAVRNEARGTATLLALTLVGPFAYVSHAGDSRAYLFRAGELRPLTTDHTLAMMQLKRGEISRENYGKSPYRKTLTQSLGATVAMRPDLAELRMQTGDRFLLCSDGLHRLVDDDAIASILGAHPKDADAAEALVAAANEAGGKDNITAICLTVRLDRAALAADMKASAACTAASGPRDEDQAPDIARQLKRCFIFAPLEDTELLRIAPYFDYQRFEPDQPICTEGETGDSMFVMIEGSANITFRGAHLTTLEPGGHAGEIALIRPGPRTATIRAKEAATVLVLTRSRFQEILRRQPTLGTRLAVPLMENVAARILDLQARLGDVGGILAERGDGTAL